MLNWLARLYRYKSHAGAACGLTNRFRVIQVALVGLDVGLYELRADQPSFVAESHQLARPVMRTGAGFHSNQTGRHIGKETANLLPSQGLSDHRIVSIINAVNLKYILRQIDPDSRYFHVSSPSSMDDPPHLRMPHKLKGGRPYHCPLAASGASIHDNTNTPVLPRCSAWCRATGGRVRNRRQPGTPRGRRRCDRRSAIPWVGRRN